MLSRQAVLFQSMSLTYFHTQLTLPSYRLLAWLIILILPHWVNTTRITKTNSAVYQWWMNREEYELHKSRCWWTLINSHTNRISKYTHQFMQKRFLYQGVELFMKPAAESSSLTLSLLKQKKQRNAHHKLLKLMLTSSCLVFSASKTHRYSVYCHRRQRKDANPHDWEAGTWQCLAFLLKKYLKCLIDYQTSCRLTFCWLTTYFFQLYW